MDKMVTHRRKYKHWVYDTWKRFWTLKFIFTPKEYYVDGHFYTIWLRFLERRTKHYIYSSYSKWVEDYRFPTKTYGFWETMRRWLGREGDEE